MMKYWYFSNITSELAFFF